MDSDTDIIIRNILSRIPAKSLIRFQCVSKRWRTLIKTPSFIAEHLRRQSPCLHFRAQKPRHPKQLPLPLHLLDCELQVRRVEKQPPIFELDFANIVGSCNGLICLKIVKDYLLSTLMLWNPAIRALRMIPSPAVVGAQKGLFLIGFGFSPIVSDYKIVIVWLVDYPFPGIHVEMYSLSSGSWKEVVVVEEHKILEHIHLKSDCVTANGAMFWHGAKGDADMIVSFDLATEVFTLIPLPVPSNPSLSFRLAVHEDKLALLVKHWLLENSKSVEMWVMDEGGEGGSNGEIVCNVIECGKSKIALFNVDTGEFNMLDVHDSYECFDYVESLVPLGGKKLNATFM
ncbi:unnamed protein product [Cuscuta campestris]|uniref:F-box domain-containing protein n=1 Tax=Cuscuta campestris TaxID=132261 RepID=A0A484K803_9ASTE|nr:unnamed protein product [Cuscuta campestris]